MVVDEVDISSGHLLIIGDMNIQMDNPSCTFANNFLTQLDMCNLKHCGDFSTHAHGHTLVLVLFQTDELNRTNIHYNLSAASDHSMLLSDLDIPKPRGECHVIKYRRWKNVDFDSLQRAVVLELTGTGCEDNNRSDVLLQ